MILNSVSPWEAHPVDRLQQLLDILHISHMWEIGPGIDFATKEIEDQFEIRPAQSLFLAKKYQIQGWVNGAVRALLNNPLIVHSLILLQNTYSRSFLVLHNRGQGASGLCCLCNHRIC